MPTYVPKSTIVSASGTPLRVVALMRPVAVNSVGPRATPTETKRTAVMIPITTFWTM